MCFGLLFKTSLFDFSLRRRRRNQEYSSNYYTNRNLGKAFNKIQLGLCKRILTSVPLKKRVLKQTFIFSESENEYEGRERGAIACHS